MEGNQQVIHVHCIPTDGIEALLNGQKIVHRQGAFHLSKKRDTHYLTLSREGFHSSTVAFNREINPFWPVANLVWGPLFPVGWLVDWMTGSVYQIEPRDLHVVLKPFEE